MLTLDLPAFDFKYMNENGKLKIFDVFRKAYVQLTPEEWVRQNFLMFMVDKKCIPISHILIEGSLKINDMNKRFDAVIFNRHMNATVLFEFKSPDIQLNNAVFEQINAYNFALASKLLIVSNGLIHYCSNLKKSKIEFTKININDLPLYKDL